MTDAEVFAVLLEVVSHPPPMRLNVTSLAGFLLPEAIDLEGRSEFAACGVGGLNAVNASIQDPRFQVVSEYVSKGLDCTGVATKKIRQLKVVRTRDSSCGEWCSFYRPWSDVYDVAVTLSVPHCFEEAIHFDDVDAFRKISESVGAPQAKKMFDNCGMLVSAVQQNRSILVSELLKGPESERANPDGRDGDKETPLQAAAESGNLGAMQQLLDAEADLNHQSSSGGTALFTAARNCQTNAMEFLLAKGASPNSLMNQTGRTTCQVTPLLSLFGHGRVDACHGEKLKETIKVLVDRGANMSVPAASANCDKNQTALTLALDKKDAAAVEQLLELNADPNEAGRLSNGVHGVLIKPFALEISQILDYWKPVSDSVKFLELLKQHGADVDETQHGYTPLWMAAAQCRVEAVELLLKLGAEPNKGKTPAKDAAKEYADSSCQSPEEKQSLLAAFKDK